MIEAPPYNLEEERKEILRKYRNILKVCRPDTTLADKRRIRKAFNFAMEAHKDMRRRSGEPYIYHPLDVAYICGHDIGLGVTSTICALLHDVVEDTDYTVEDMRAMFGDRVAQIIDGLTKITGLFKKNTQTTSIQAENFKKMLLTLSDDVRVILIKLADRVHNMRTLDSMPSNKQLKIASETSYLYAPLAHRLGLYNIKTELEDLSLKYTEPDMYEMIERKVLATEEERNRFIRNFIAPLKKALKAEGMDADVIGRAKSIHSILGKMRSKKIPFEEVYDKLAIRVIIKSNTDEERINCWKAYSIVTGIYRPNPERLRDWISIPKANGYEALHTTVMSKSGNWVEVQIRSERMHEIAEKGYAAHWKYKGAVDYENGLDRWLNKIQDLLKGSESDALDFLDDFKMNLFAEEIYVFTPKGEMRTLPNGATALDFAYAIHSQVGHKCIGAKVNTKLVPLSTRLKGGDQIEIITSSKQKPSEDWYNFVATARAKSEIKKAIRKDKELLSSKGKQILESLFNQLKIDFSNKNVINLRNYYEIESVRDLYYEVAIGKVGIKEIKDFYNDREKNKLLRYLRDTFIKSRDGGDKKVNETVLKQLTQAPNILFLGDKDNLTYLIADCCSAIVGDDVIGLTQNDGTIEVHRTNCQNAIRMMSRYDNRIVKAKWNDSEKVEFMTCVKFSGLDSRGMLMKITQIITEEMQLNIQSIQINTEAGLFDGEIMVFVNDTDQLTLLINSLKNLDGMNKVYRINRK